MPQAQLSVIIPVYNAEKYLRRCLDSILEQNLSELEIICINDGSVDKSLDILNEYAAKDTRVCIVDQKNAGQSVARNVGLSMAQGEYIGFVDSDDWIDIDFYEKLYNAAILHKADIVQCGYRAVSTKKTKNYFCSEQLSCNFCDKINALRNGFVWNKIYRRELLCDSNLKFLEGLIFEDILFSVQTVYYADSFLCISGGYYNYFSNPLSTVNCISRQEKRKQDSFTIIKEIINFGTEHLSETEQLCLAKFATEQMVRSCNISDKADYKEYLNLLGPSSLLRKKRFRAIKSKIFHFSWRKKIFIVLGFNFFWQKG